MRDDFQYYIENEMFHGFLTNIMGTRFDIIFFDKHRTRAETLWQILKSELISLDKMLNKFDKNSDVSQINLKAYHEEVELSDELWVILNDCYSFYEKTQGFFDITLRDMSKVILSEINQTVTFLSADTSLDLGAYAKGYALKKVLDFLKSKDVQHAFVDFGGSSIYGVGHHPYGDSWKVSVKNPYKQTEKLAEIVLKNNSLSTSGNTNTYTNHIVNPLNGKTNNERKLVCVVSKDPIEAEVLSTVLMILPEEKKEEIIAKFDVDSFQIFNLT